MQLHLLAPTPQLVSQSVIDSLILHLRACLVLGFFGNGFLVASTVAAYQPQTQVCKSHTIAMDGQPASETNKIVISRGSEWRRAILPVGSSGKLINLRPQAASHNIARGAGHCFSRTTLSFA